MGFTKMTPKQFPKRKSGRFPELKEKDIVEVRWIDATSSSRWYDDITECPVHCITLGYFERYDYSKELGDYIVLSGSHSELGHVSHLSSVPLPNIEEIRVVSKGESSGSK